MAHEVPSRRWGELASRFHSELALQKSEVWRLSGLQEEYDGPADGNFYRERELNALIDALTGLLVQAAAREMASRQLTGSASRRAGRPKDVVTPFLAPELLSVFLRCHDRAGRQSVTVGTSVDGKPKQEERGELSEFITAIIQPLNQYLTTELGRLSLSASRLARFALDERRRTAQAPKRCEASPSAKGAAAATKPQLPPGVIALQRALAMPQ